MVPISCQIRDVLFLIRDYAIGDCKQVFFSLYISKFKKEENDNGGSSTVGIV